MTIRVTYEIVCAPCGGYVGDRYDTREAAEAARAELLTLDPDRWLWLCDDCATPDTAL